MNRALPAGFAAAVLTIGLTPTPAGADDGDWDRVACGPADGDREEGCMWRTEVGGSSRLMSSWVRDSEFNNEAWYNDGPTINDDIAFVQNTFDHQGIQAFRHQDYSNGDLNPTSCTEPLDDRGPYTRTSPSGLSSFKGGC
jgi:hypothetical protein